MGGKMNGDGNMKQTGGLQRYFRGKGVYQREDSDDSSNQSSSEESEENESEESEQDMPIMKVKFQKKAKSSDKRTVEGVVGNEIGKDEKHEQETKKDTEIEHSIEESNSDTESDSDTKGNADTESNRDSESDESSESCSSEISGQEIIHVSKKVRFQRKKRIANTGKSDDREDLQKEKSRKILKGIKRNMAEVDREDMEQKLRGGWGKIEDQIVAHLDDNDEASPKLEYEQWKKREMARLWREREEMIKREKMMG